jgi:glycosyltransferase involved in cell wall biosynthesis
MKIVFLTPNLEMHGGNLVLLKYADYLINKGHEIIIISSSKVALNINPKIKLRLYKYFPIPYVDFFLLQKIYFQKIIELIPECDFLIPIYTPLLPAVVAAKMKKQLNAQIVLLFQDFFNMVWTGRWIKKIMENPQIQKNLSTAICVTKQSAKSLNEISAVKTEVVTNGIDTENLYDRKLKKEPYILFVGRPQIPLRPSSAPDAKAFTMRSL